MATVEAKGYERARVADLLTLSGVSRKAFYELFSSKQDCLLGAVEALIEMTIVPVLSAIDKPPGMERARDAFGAFIDSVAAQPAAARMCVVEIYAAGPRAVAVADRAMDAAATLMEQALDQMPGREGMPPGDRSGDGRRAAEDHAQAPLPPRRGAELPKLVPDMWNWGLASFPLPRLWCDREGGALENHARSKSTSPQSASSVRWLRPLPRTGTRRRSFLRSPHGPQSR